MTRRYEKNYIAARRCIQKMKDKLTIRVRRIRENGINRKDGFDITIFNKATHTQSIVWKIFSCLFNLEN